MNLQLIKKNYKNNGFIIIRNIFRKNQIKKILEELEHVKKKVEKINNKQFFHKTIDGSINTIHDIHKIYKQY